MSRGKIITFLRLAFVDGRVVDISAPDAADADSIRELLSLSSGDKDVIAGFAIGLNPGITEPVGVNALDGVIGGSVHIETGMNESYGGNNRSNLHLDFVVLHPTVWLDDALVISDGRPVL